MSRKLIFEAIVLVLVFASIWGIFSLFPIFPEKGFGLDWNRIKNLLPQKENS